MAKITKSIKRAIATGAIIGALVGSQTTNLLDTYRKALDSAKYATNTEISTYENAFKKDSALKSNKVLSEGYEKAIKEYDEIRNRLERYQKANDTKKAKMIASDFKRYGLTAKSFKPSVPLSKEGAEKAGKGAIGGAGIGLGGLAIWKIRRKSKKGKKK